MSRNFYSLMKYVLFHFIEFVSFQGVFVFLKFNKVYEKSLWNYYKIIKKLKNYYKFIKLLLNYKIIAKIGHAKNWLLILKN